MKSPQKENLDETYQSPTQSPSNLLPQSESTPSVPTPSISRQKDTAVRVPMPRWLKICLPLVILVMGNLIYQNVKVLISEQSFYRLKTVELVGIDKMDPYMLAKKLGLEKNINLLWLDEGELTQKLRKIDRFQSGEVNIHFPDTVIITVEEKVPDFMIRVGNNTDLVEDPQGMKLITVTKDLVPVAVENEVNSFNLFTIEIDSFSHVDMALQHAGLNNFIEIYHQLPETEKDIRYIFSGIKLSSYEDQIKQNIFYFDKGNKKVILTELSLDQVRRARYAALYLRSLPKKQADATTEIEIKENWVLLRESDPESLRS